MVSNVFKVHLTPGFRQVEVRLRQTHGKAEATAIAHQPMRGVAWVTAAWERPAKQRPRQEGYFGGHVNLVKSEPRPPSSVPL